ncbi:MAG: hypothetical protein OXF11_05515 [Deltaproteobacteria bacterium]|nr:hypothetical protein [Deltaproteobacteria bacterium]
MKFLLILAAMLATSLVPSVSQAQTTPTLTTEVGDGDRSESNSHISFGILCRYNGDPCSFDYPIAVRYRITESGDMLAPGVKGVKTCTIDATGDFCSVNVSAIDDLVNERDSRVDFRIISAQGVPYDDEPVTPFRIGSPATQSITVTDDDMRVVALEASASTVFHGQSIRFTVKHDGTTGQPVTVSLNIDDYANVVTNSKPTSITIPRNRNSTSFTLGTRSGATTSAEIGVTVNAGKGYITDTYASKSVSVTPAAFSQRVSIDGDGAIPEGNDVIFSISRSIRSSDDMPVNVYLSTAAAQAYTSETTGLRTVTIPANESLVFFEDNDSRERDQ